MTFCDRLSSFSGLLNYERTRSLVFFFVMTSMSCDISYNTRNADHLSFNRDARQSRANKVILGILQRRMVIDMTPEDDGASSQATEAEGV